MGVREELTGYAPGEEAKGVLELCEKKGGNSVRYFSGAGIVQAERDSDGVWHFYKGEEE